jgi:transcriptional regulator with XRE-family HTH domain
MSDIIKTETYGSFIKRRRTILSISQSDLGKALNCTYQAVSKYENDEVEINLQLIGVLCRKLEVDLNSFFNLEYRKQNNNCDMYDFNAKNFVRTLIYLREKKHYTQKMFAKQLKINNRKISRWEIGTSLPSLSEFKQIIKVLNVSYDELYFCLVDISSNLLTTKKERTNKNIVILSISVFVVLSCAIGIPYGIQNLKNNVDNTIVDDGKIDYTVNDDGLTIRINKVKTTEKELTITNKINGYIVESIAEEAFRYNAYIEKLTIQSPLKMIGDNAFANMKNLKSLALTQVNKSTIVGHSLLEGCKNLHYFKTGIVTDKNTNGDFLFNYYGFNQTKDIALEFNDSTTYIPNSYIQNENTIITSLVLPTSLAYLVTDCFKYCVNLNKVTFDEGIKEINGSNFPYLTQEVLSFPSTTKKVTGNFGNHLFKEIKNLSKDYFCPDFIARTVELNLTSAATIQLSNNQNIYVQNLASFNSFFEPYDTTLDDSKLTFLNSDSNNLQIYFFKCASLPEYLAKHPTWINSSGTYQINFGLSE